MIRGSPRSGRDAPAVPGAPGLRRSGHRLRIAAVLVAIFALSVLLRLPLWDKPGLLFEMLNYQTLSRAQICTEESLARDHFAPIFSFQRDADKFIANRSGITDALGNHYTKTSRIRHSRTSFPLSRLASCMSIRMSAC